MVPSHRPWYFISKDSQVPMHIGFFSKGTLKVQFIIMLVFAICISTLIVLTVIVNHWCHGMLLIFFFFFKVISVCSVGLEFMTLWSGCILYWQSQPDAHILGVLRLPTYLSCDFCLCLNMHKIPNLEAYKSSLCVSELGTKYALFSCSNNIFFLLFHRKFLRNLLLNRSTLKSSVCKMKADFPTL